MDHLDEVLELIQKAKYSEDEVERELAQELCEAAYKYIEYRLMWNFYSPSEKDANDNSRTIAHNRVIDTFNIFFRYMKSKENSVPDFSGLDRKIIGDYACELVAKVAISQR